MNLAGLIRTSLLDDPGYLCCVAFTAGCNLRCPYCHNAGLVGSDGREGFPPDVLWEHLESRRGRLDGLTVTGGEPTLHDDLADLLAEAKRRGFRTKLDSNGTRPEILERLIEADLVDRIALDVKLPLERYGELGASPEQTGAVGRSLALLLEGTTDVIFRATVVPGLHDEADLEALGRLFPAGKRFVIQNFRPGTTLDERYRERSPFPPSRLEGFRKILEARGLHVEVRP
ncbi:MAG: anaerobic ribonucleoside-triphosphate reductase activating protein [Synergistaceae bacterium]|nr:anaerobic ribonucleoside-triphosphate reductase activating protein [Synergistaceae bacterium]